MAINPLPLAGVGLAAVAVAGGLYMGGNGTDTSNTPSPTQETTLITLADAKEFVATEDKEKFGYRFSLFFLSDKGDNNSEEWSKRANAMKGKKNDIKADGFFKDIKENVDGDKLKQACKTQYDSKTYSTDNKDKDWKEIWTYCSKEGKKPTTIEEAKDAIKSVAESTNEQKYTAENGASGDTKLGKTLKDSAISTYDKNNDSFWAHWQIEFKAGKLDDTTKTNSHFDKNNSSNKEIRVLCREAYETTGTGSSPTQEDIKRYCTLKGK